MTLDDTTFELPAVHEAWLPREHSLHRPRHGVRQLTALICAVVFFTAPTAMWLFGARSSPFENRPLAPFPSLTAGWGFFTGMSAWATDHLVFREDAIQAADSISRTFFNEPAPFEHAPIGPLTGETPAPGNPPPGGINGPEAQPPDARVIEGRDGWLYLAADMSSKCNPSRPTTETVQLLSRLRTVVEASGRQFVLAVAPDKSTMVPGYLPASYPNKECAAAVHPVLWRQVLTDGKSIDLRVALQSAERSAGHPVYYRNDTHWTDEGSLTMVRSIAEKIAPGVTATWRTPEETRFSIPADLPPLIGHRGNREGVLYQLQPAGRENRTQPPELNLLHVVHRTSDPTPGTVTRPVLVLGDSFTGVSSPYLAAAFTDLSMLNYLSANDRPADAIKAMVDSEVVVLEMVERVVALGGGSWLKTDFLDELERELAQHPVR